jgi:hypothetical protein
MICLKIYQGTSLSEPLQENGECPNHRNLKSRSLKVKTFGEKCPRYEHPTSNHKLYFPAIISHGTIFNACIVWGTYTLGTFFTLHGLILLLDF